VAVDADDLHAEGLAEARDGAAYVAQADDAQRHAAQLEDAVDDVPPGPTALVLVGESEREAPRESQYHREGVLGYRPGVDSHRRRNQHGAVDERRVQRVVHARHREVYPLESLGAAQQLRREVPHDGDVDVADFVLEVFFP